MRDGACRWSQNRPPVAHSRNHADGWSGAQIGSASWRASIFSRDRPDQPYCARACARAGFKPAPTSASSGRGLGGGVGPPCGFHGGDWLVVGPRGGGLGLCWTARGLINPPLRLRRCLGGRASLFGGVIGLWWAVGGTEGGDFALGRVRARAGLKPAPTSASSGRGGGGSGLLAGSTVGFGLWWAVGGTEGGDFALGCSAGAGAGGFETRPYVCLFGTRWGGDRASLRVPRWGLACGGRLVGPRGATSPWAVLLVRARAGLKPAPTSASSGRGGGGRASLRVPRWGLACGGRLVGPRGGDFALGCSAGAGAGGFETRPYVCLFGTRWRGGRASLRVPRWGLACGGRLVGPRGATSPWAVLLVRARAGLKPAPTSASSGRGVGGPGLLRVPRWGLACGGRLVGPRGATSPWAVLLVRARAGLKPAPTSASSGRGSGLLAGSTVGIGLWWAVGGTEGGRLRLGLFCWCGRGRV